VSSFAPPVGLAAGALGTAVLVAYGPDPTGLVFWLLVGAFAAAALAVLGMPEPVEADSTWLAALRPHVRLPRDVRAPFVAAVPSLVAVWALSSLYLSLGPSLAVHVLHLQSRLAGGLTIAALTGGGAAATILARGVTPRRAIIGGSAALIMGVAMTLAGIQEVSAGLFFAGSVVAGLGFGPVFSGTFRWLVTLAQPRDRAGLVASVYVVSYLAFSVPAIVAGVVSADVGLRHTTTIYGAVVIALVAVATFLFLQGSRESGTAPSADDKHPPCPGTVAVHAHRSIHMRPPGLPLRAPNMMS
jgi:hypothetical protein